MQRMTYDSGRVARRRETSEELTELDINNSGPTRRLGLYRDFRFSKTPLQKPKASKKATKSHTAVDRP